MKRLHSYIAVFMALVGAQAYAAPGPFGGGMLGGTGYNLLGPVAQYDLNGDGRITPEELDAAKAKIVDELLTRFLARFDANTDGNVTSDEVSSVFEPATEDWLARILARFDLNRDRRLSGSELPALSPLRAYDTNNDGVLTTEELTAAAQARLDLQVEQLISQYDTNNDDQISGAELQAVFAAQANRMIASLLARFDLNDDGTITTAEVTSVLQHRPRSRGGRMGM